MTKDGLMLIRIIFFLRVVVYDCPLPPPIWYVHGGFDRLKVFFPIIQHFSKKNSWYSRHEMNSKLGNQLEPKFSACIAMIRISTDALYPWLTKTSHQLFLVHEIAFDILIVFNITQHFRLVVFDRCYKNVPSLFVLFKDCSVYSLPGTLELSKTMWST